MRNDEAWTITVKHCKEEVKTIAFLSISCVSLITCQGLLLFLLWGMGIKPFTLPFSFRLTFLPSEFGRITNFAIDSCYQNLLSILTLIVMFSFFPLAFLFMNHSCWEVEQTTLLVAKLTEGDRKQTIKSAVKQSYEALSWINDVQSILQFVFFAEFSIQCLTLCVCFYSFLLEPLGTFTVFTLTFVLLSQNFSFCALGNRVITRIDVLTAALYDVTWYEMTSSEKKSLQIILRMAQNMKSFNAIFYDVSMETFQKVRSFNFIY